MHSRYRRLLLSLLIMVVFSPIAHSQQRRSEVTWVNPDIQDMPGLKHHVLASTSLGQDVGYVVWTPPELAKQDGERKYPVVYFLHGAGGSEASASVGFSSRVAQAIQKDQFPAAICVFPNGGMSGYRGEVESMIVDELIPLIDQNYPTAGAGARVVCGFSMGGAGSVHLSLRHPQLFRAAGSWGGALSFRGDAAESPLLDVAQENRQALSQNGFTLLTINGDQDRPKAFDPLQEILTSHSIPHRHIVLQDTKHNLGKYYELSADTLLEFLAHQLRDNLP